MGRVRVLCLSVLAAVVVSVPRPSPAPAQQPPAAKGRKIALLIGVNQYANRKLDNLRFAERDVDEMASVLRASGFEVRAVRGADGIDPRAGRTGKGVYFTALAEALAGVTKDDTVLLAFSGHGVQLIVKEADPDGRVADKEVPFFCPADAVPSDPNTLVSINAVLKLLDERGGGHNLVLVDACRNVVDPNKGARGGINGGRIDNLPEGTAVFFSCSGRQKAVETDRMFAPGSGRGHGLFFHFVLEGLKGAPGATDARGRVTWERLVPFVKEQVKEKAAEWLPDVPPAERQVPFAVGSLGDIPPLAEGFGGLRPNPKNPGGAGEPKAGDVRSFEVAPGVFMEFCWIPEGEAQLGAPKAEMDAVRRHLLSVNIDAKLIDDTLAPEAEALRGKFRTKGFWLGKYEVTQEEWKAVMGNNPSHFNGTNENAARDMDTSRFPVERVSWNDAQAFLAKANARPGVGEKFGAGKFVLPHENEWEYAARGGLGNKRAFYWGDSLNGTEANCFGRDPLGTTVEGPQLNRPVAVDDTNGGNYKVHPWGLRHMLGNIWELCENQCELPGKPKDNVAARGGTFFVTAHHSRTAHRNGCAPTFAQHYIGFRVAFRPQN